MGAEMDFVAIPLLADVFGIGDVEQLIVQLATVRQWQAERDARDD